MTNAAQEIGNSSEAFASLKTILFDAEQAILKAVTIDDVENLRVGYLGKSGIITEKLKVIASLPNEDKKTYGAEVNKLKNKVSEIITAKKQEFEEALLEAKLKEETLDVTIPARQIKKGSVHPISQVIEECVEILGSIGFKVAEGPEIEDDFHNFTALNIPENHPARQMHDTFYVKSDDNGEEDFVLRTHTSPVQIREMKNAEPPIKIIAPGRTFRCDSDQTHSPMFHQIEGLYIDEDVSMGHLKGCLQQFVDQFFGKENLKMRFRASFFPFTEPSAEVDIGCSKKGDTLKIGEGEDWLEILGCGMVHPNVLKNAGLDPKKYRGFAFGMGIERLAMLKYGMSDLRAFFDNDIRWLKNYGFNHFDIPSLLKGW